MQTDNRFQQPPEMRKADGEERRVGVELEFSGVSLDQAAECVRSALGGEVERKSAATRLVHAPGGEFKVTVDWEYLIKRSAEQAEAGEPERWLDELSEAATLLVPIEVICPPIALSGLTQVDEVVSALREAGATGTGESMVAAYGLHLNVEPPALDATTLQAYLEAFSLLQWWLFKAHEVDTTRKLSPYISTYPEEYVTELLSQEPDSVEAIMRLYLAHNASRNMALDMLPLLAEFDEDKVTTAVDDSLIESRPAFHYRLPNCDIDQPGWSVSQAWNTWCVVEELASRPEERRELAEQYREKLRPLIGLNHSGWREFTETWLNEREWA